VVQQQVILKTEKVNIKIMNRDYPLATSPKPKLLTPKRVNEIADSLQKSSIANKKLAFEQQSIGDATVRNKVADKKVIVDGYSSTLSGNDRLKIAAKARQEATTDSSNADRYRKLADKASKKK